jgi:hypothetical protein
MPLYPNLYLPVWQIEGLAVHEEARSRDKGASQIEASARLST